MKRRRASVVRFRMLRIMTGTVPLVLAGIYLCHLGLSTLTNRRSSQAASFATPSYRSAAWARLPDASVAASDPAVF
jgi:hypothetical protein